MAMFSNAKIGDRVWSFEYGWGTIVEIDANCRLTGFQKLTILVQFDLGMSFWYTCDGIISFGVKQTLFWDELKFDIPKKPFDLKKEYKKLKRKKFVSGEHNYAIYSYEDDSDDNWSWDDFCSLKTIGANYYEEESLVKEFVDLLNEHKVTSEQLEKVIKEVEMANDKTN